MRLFHFELRPVKQVLSEGSPFKMKDAVQKGDSGSADKSSWPEGFIWVYKLLSTVSTFQLCVVITQPHSLFLGCFLC